jgi:cell division protein FtsA
MAIKTDRIIAGLDVGTAKCAAVVGEIARDGNINIIGYGTSQSAGMGRGVISDLDAASAGITKAIEDAERQAGIKLDNVYVNVTGSHISSVNSRGVVAVTKSNRDITPEDVTRVLDSARSMTIPAQREILHVIPRTYMVDGQDGVRDPIGMSGYRLEVETHIVTGAIGSLNNLFKAVQRSGVEVEELTLNSLASSEAVLSDAEKRLGVCLVDIGAGTTDVAIYIDGSIWHTAVIPVGGNHITNDISIVLRTPLEAAEQLKLQHGDAAVTAPYKGMYADYYGKGPLKHDFRGRSRLAEAEPETARDIMLEVPAFEPGRFNSVPKSTLNEIIHARTRQIFDMVQGEIKKSGYDGMIPAGVVLTGGGAKLAGINDAAAHVLRLPVRSGEPRGLDGANEQLGDLTFSTGMGLVLWGLQKRTQEALLRESGKRGGNPKNALLGRKVSGWLREFLP